MINKYIEEKFMDEEPEHSQNGFWNTDYYKNWLIELQVDDWEEIGNRALMLEKIREQNRIIRDIDVKIEEEVFKDYSKQEVIDEIICIVKNI